MFKAAFMHNINNYRLKWIIMYQVPGCVKYYINIRLSNSTELEFSNMYLDYGNRKSIMASFRQMLYQDNLFTKKKTCDLPTSMNLLALFLKLVVSCSVCFK